MHTHKNKYIHKYICKIKKKKIKKKELRYKRVRRNEVAKELVYLKGKEDSASVLYVLYVT